MDIRNTKELKRFAAARLAEARVEKLLVALYAGIALGLSVVVSLLSYCLSLAISKTGGLGSIGTRTVLSSIQTMLPLARSLVVICLELGYLAAMLRIARGQYVSVRTLKLGFDRFWPLMRLTLMRGVIFAGLAIAAVYGGSLLYVLTPFSNEAVALILPHVSGGVMDTAFLSDPVFFDRLLHTMIPCFILCGLLYALLGLPILYRLRLSSFLLIDKPGWGAMAALRESRRLMRGNCWKLFRADLSLWSFYAALAAVMALSNGDLLLEALGVQLPLSPDGAYYLFYGLSLAAQFAAYYFLSNRAQVVYGCIYDALRPPEQPKDSVVLGNIFQM